MDFGRINLCGGDMTKLRLYKLAAAILALVLIAAVPMLRQGARVSVFAVECRECAAVAARVESSDASEKYNAKAALLKDFNSGEVLLSQNSDARLPIASMVKIMTLNLIFEDMDKGIFDSATPIPVSQNAASMGGSQAFLDAGSSYAADELIKSIIVASANDACVAMAEHISGSVEVFVERMNQKASALGMSNTNFENCTGLPSPNAYSSAADVAVMFRELASHARFYDYAKVWMYDLVHPGGRVTGLTNTNKLVRFYNGCDGGKTGFTTEALSCLAATAKRGDTRLIAVIVAAPEAKERNAETSRLFNYGFANFETKKVVSEDMEISDVAKVESGKQESVAVKPQSGFYKLMKKGVKAEFEQKIYLDVLRAPVAAGDVAGRIEILSGGEKIAEVNLVAAADVKKASFLDIVNKMVGQW